MRKYGKYERRPEPKAPAGVLAKKVNTKRPQVKSMLLQTYFTSLLCLVLCVTMFFGTSYAWFTSEVNNTANEIYVGTLKVGLYKGNSKDNNLANSNEKLFDSNIRWEPGYTALETITVVNEGDLAFKYVLYFTDGTGKVSVATDAADLTAEQLTAVARHFDVWSYYHKDNVGPSVGSYKDIKKENGWYFAGTLDQVLNGAIVLQNNMVSVRREGQEASAVNAGTTDGLATHDTYTIALHMKEDADESVMGQKITLNVKLVAYQMASNQEPDGFKNASYDDITIASDAKQLKNEATSGGYVVLISDIAPADDVQTVTMTAGVLDGDGHRISVGIKTTVDSNLTVKNTKISAELTPVGNVILDSCTISAANLKLSGLIDGKTVTLVNCVVDDHLIEKAVLTASGDADGKVFVTSDNSLIEVDNGVITVQKDNT